MYRLYISKEMFFNILANNNNNNKINSLFLSESKVEQEFEQNKMEDDQQQNKHRKQIGRLPHGDSRIPNSLVEQHFKWHFVFVVLHMRCPTIISLPSFNYFFPWLIF